MTEKQKPRKIVTSIYINFEDSIHTQVFMPQHSIIDNSHDDPGCTRNAVGFDEEGE